MIVEGGVDAAEGVHVLDLHLRAELRLAHGADGDVHVGAHVALFEVAVAHAGVDEHLLERREIGDRLVGGRHVRLRDDLHEGRAAAVEVHARALGVVVDLRGVLLQVDVVDADELGSVGRLDRDAAADAEGIAVLGDLVVLGHVGVEVVLPVEGGVAVDLAAEHEAAHDGELHGLLVRDGQGAGVAQAHGAHVGVGFAAGLQQAAAEHLRLCLELDVRLQPDGVFEFHVRSRSRVGNGEYYTTNCGSMVYCPHEKAHDATCI